MLRLTRNVARIFVPACLLLPLVAPPADAVDSALKRRLDAVKADPDEPRNYYNLGIEYYNRDELVEAAKAFEKALKVGKKNVEAHKAIDLDCHHVLGTIAMRRKDFKHAASWYASGLKINAKDPVCLFGRGQAFFYGRNFKNAKKALVRYLELTKGDAKASKQAPTALTYLGAMAMERKKFDEAAGYFRRVIQEYPDSSKEAGTNLCIVLLTRGDAQFKKGRLEQAAPLYDEAVGANPANSDALKASALTHYELGVRARKNSKDANAATKAKEHFRIAERNLLRAGKLKKGDFQIWYYAGLSQFELEKYQEMIDSYHRSVEIDPNQSAARYNLALALLRQQQYESAAKEAETAKRLTPKDSDTIALVNNVYDSWKEDLLGKANEAMTQDQVNDAVALWRKVLKLDPHAPDVEDLIQQAVARRTELIADHLKRGDIAFEEGKLLTASNEWNAAARLDPDNADIKAKLKKVSVGKQVQALLAQAQSAYNAKDYELAETKALAALALNKRDAKTKALLKRIKARKSSGVKRSIASINADLQKDDLLSARNTAMTARRQNPKNAEIKKLLLTINSRIDKAIESNLAAADTAMKGKNKAAAIKAYERVLAFDPDNEVAARQIRKLTGQESKAIVIAKEIDKLNKRGIFAYMQNDLKGAEKAWSDALKLDPGNDEIKSSLARVRRKLKART